MKNHTKKWHPDRTLFAPRGNSDPGRMESRLRDALRPSQHGDVKIFTREEIDTLNRAIQQKQQ